MKNKNEYQFGVIIHVAYSVISIFLCEMVVFLQSTIIDPPVGTHLDVTAINNYVYTCLTLEVGQFARTKTYGTVI